jgi:hypothetical protein
LSGVWSDPSVWATLPPAAGADVRLNTGGTNVASVFDVGGSVQFGNIWIQEGTPGAGEFAVQIQDSALTLRAQSLSVGNDGAGRFIHQAGTVTVAGTLAMGLNDGGAGFYELRGGTLSTGGSQTLGYLGSATFVQTGGVNQVGGELDIGQGIVKSQYTLSGADSRLAVTGTERIFFGSSFSQTGGSHTAGTILADGKFTLQSGTVVARTMYVGQAGPATFLQSGGSIRVTESGYPALRWASPSAGTVSRFTVTNGATITSAGGFYVNGLGTTIVDQYDSTITVEQPGPYAAINIDSGGQAPVTYNLRVGGNLIVHGYEMIGGFGSRPARCWRPTARRSSGTRTPRAACSRRRAGPRRSRRSRSASRAPGR